MGRALIVANVLLYLSGAIATSLACLPLEKLWHPWVPGHCIDRRTLDLCTAAFNLVMDLSILILPQRVIWKLQMTAKRKLGVSLVFSIGLVYVELHHSWSTWPGENLLNRDTDSILNSGHAPAQRADFTPVLLSRMDQEAMPRTTLEKRSSGPWPS